MKLLGLWAAGLLACAPGAAAAQSGPFDIPLFAAAPAPAAQGQARLVYADSPFGVAVTEDGRARFDVQLTARGLPDPAFLGPYHTYVAWAATPDLAQWVRLGPVTNGRTTVGPVEFNKFLFVVTAEPDTAAAGKRGPTVLHGTSPSGWLQSFLTHPLFRGVSAY